MGAGAKRHAFPRRRGKAGFICDCPTSSGRAAALAAAPPTAPFAGLLQLVEPVLEPHQLVFGGKPDPAFIESLALRLDDALVHGAVLPAQVLDLLLQIAPLGQLALQGG